MYEVDAAIAGVDYRSDIEFGTVGGIFKNRHCLGPSSTVVLRTAEVDDVWSVVSAVLSSSNKRKERAIERADKAWDAVVPARKP